MNSHLLIPAALLTIVVALVHSILGEVLIFNRLRAGTIVPTQGGFPRANETPDRTCGLMAWRAHYHRDVEKDLLSMGRAQAREIILVIETRIAKGEPDKLGKPLLGQLAGCRRIRTGQTRIVYKVDGARIEILIIAVGVRRDNEVYDAAASRVD
jgi:mRNA interferase RelE/StbE